MGIPVYFKTLIQDYNDLCLPDTRKLNIDKQFIQEVEKIAEVGLKIT